MAINAGEILVRFRADSRGAVREFNRFNATINKTLVTAQTQIRDLNRSLNGFGLLAGVGLGAAILKIGNDFDKAITNVRAITKETEDQFETTRASAIALASEFGKSADEVGSALYQIVSAGRRGNDAMETLTASTKLAKAGLTDTAVATDVLIGTLNAFAIDGSKASDIAGKLIGTVDRGILTFEELASKIGQVSPVAAGAGVRLEELLGILALLTRNGVSFTNAVTQVRGAILKLVAPGKEARKEIENLLGSTIEASLATRGYIGTLEEVVTASDGSVAAFRRLFEDTEAIQGITAIASAGFDSLREDIASLDGAGLGNLNQVLEIQSKSFAQLSTELASLIKNRVVAFFEENREAIIGTTEAIIGFLRENEALVDIVIGSTAAIAGLSAAGLVLKTFLVGLDSIITATTFVLGTLAGTKKADTVATAANTAAVAVNKAEFIGNAAAIKTNSVARTTAIVATNAQTAAIARQNQLLLSGAVAQTSAAAATRVYVTNTANAAAATGGLAAAFAKFFPTFSKIPALFKSGAAFSKIFSVALGGLTVIVTSLAAKLAALAAVAGVFFVAGRALSRWVTGNTKEWEEQVKTLRKVEERYGAVQAVARSAYGSSRAGAETASQSVNQFAETARALATEMDNLANGVEGSEEKVAKLREALDKMRPTAEQSTETLRDRLSEFEQIIRSAADEAGGLEDSYQGAFTAGGRALQGFGATAAEIDALVAKFGQVEAESIVREIKQIKDELSGLGQAQRDYEAAARRAATANGLLGASIARAGEATEQYGKELESLSEKTRDLTTGEFTKAFDEIADPLIKTEEIISGILNEIAALESNIQQFRFDGIDPALIEQATEKLQGLESQLATATTTANLFGQALRNLIDSQNDEILAKRLEAIDQIKQAEIRALQDAGRVREAEELAAQVRRDQSIRRIEESQEEEKRRIEEINALLERTNLTDAEREALEITRERARALSDLYDDQKQGIEEAYGRELQAIERNAAEQRRRLEDEQQRRTLIALEQEKADQARIAVQSRITGDLAAELAARARIAQIELEILGTKGLQAEQELELIDATKERLELLKQELESISNTGGSIEDQINAIRDAQRDIGGASDVRGAREGIRDQLSDTQTQQGLEEQRDAFNQAIEAERQARERQYQDAVRKGDEEEAERIRQRARDLREIQKIYEEEHQRRLQQIAEESKAREEAEKKRQQDQQQQQPATATQSAPADAAPGQQPQTPASDTRQQTGPEPIRQPGESGDSRASEQIKTLQEESTKTTGEIRKASEQLASTTEAFRSAITELGASMISTLGIMNGKIAEIAKQTNANTAAISEIGNEARAIRIEGRN